MKEEEFWIGVFVLLAGISRLTYLIERQRFYLRLLDKKLDALLKQQGVEWSSMSSQVQVLAINPGKKIAAIKLYREENPGLSIAEAKAEIERFASQIGERPSRF